MNHPTFLLVTTVVRLLPMVPLMQIFVIKIDYTCYCQDQPRKLDYNNRFTLQLTDIQYRDISGSSGWYTKRQFTFKQTECFPIPNSKLNPPFQYHSNGFPNIFWMNPKFCQNFISVEES